MALSVRQNPVLRFLVEGCMIRTRNQRLCVTFARNLAIL
uniref:Uncharacterized protein n=1 Tax=Anguilla anguilla TaxID=7936 RepID=A0A0E9RYC4_ANGAN